MPANHAKSIALTSELSQWVNELVANGEYKSASEVMRDGLRALQFKRERQQLELEEIRIRITESVNQANAGDFASGSGQETIQRAFASVLQNDID